VREGIPPHRGRIVTPCDPFVPTQDQHLYSVYAAPRCDTPQPPRRLRFYNVTACRVLLVAIFHASFDGAINQLSYDVVPASNTTRFLIFSAVIVLAATTVIITTKGQLGRVKAATAAGSG
jgi:hypothetical protein